MVRRRNRVKVVLILTFFLAVSVLSQDKQVNDDKNKRLREEILTAYQSGGKQGLLDSVKKQSDKITNKFIVDFAMAGVKERKEKWLKICKILAEEKKDEKPLADVFYETGEYFRLISNNKKASDYFEKALPLYLKLNDLLGKGNVYLSKGIIYSYTGNNAKAIEMYEKALSLFEKKKIPQSLGNVYMRKGNVYLITGEISKAFEMYEKALPFFERAKDQQGQGDLYFRKGDFYLYTGNYSKALEMYDKAKLLYEKVEDFLGQGNVHWKKGDIYLHTSDNPKALEMYKKGLFFFEKAKNYLSQGSVYGSIGDVYFYTGNHSKAIEMYEKALSLLEETGSPLSKGNVYISIGKIYFYSGDNLRALDFYEKALYFYKKAGNPNSLGNVYNNIGIVYFQSGDNSKALEMYKEALLFFEKAGSPLGKGNVYSNMGDIYFTKSDNSRALKMYEKALTFYEEEGIPMGQGNVYCNKGNIYFQTGNFLKAHEMYEKALPFFEKGGEPLGQGIVYWRKGVIYFYSKDNSKAFEMFDKALSFFEKVGEPHNQGNVYWCKGDTYSTLENYPKAIEMYEKAQFFFEKADDPLGLGNVYRSKGSVYSRSGDFAKALDMYDKAIELYTKIGNIESKSYALYEKAVVLARQEKKDKAMPFYEKSLFTLEDVRAKTEFSEMKMTLMEKICDLFKETTLFMLDNKYYGKGFKYAESMRARVFQDQMSEGLVGLEKGLKSELKEKRDKLVGKLSALTRQMQETGGKDEKKLQQLKEEYHRVESQFEDLLIKIRLENPLYASVNYPQPISARDLQTDVLKKGETLLSYFISQEKAYAFIASQESFKVKDLKVNEKKINGYIERYLHSIKENNTNDMNRFGSLLYVKLFQPLEKYLKNSREIIIVPAGKLETIPFESLIVDKNESGQPVFLLEKYRMKYLQSASLLSILRKHYRRDSDTRSFIGFGDPVYDYENFKQGKPEQGSMKIFATENKEVTERAAHGDEIKENHRDRYARAGGIMDRLPHSGEEVKTIARLFEKESLNSVVHLREKAAEEKAKAANMKEFDYIHFSCHGLLGDDFQSLVLSQLPPDKSKEDGYFTLNEIMNCDYNAKLVVLSACQTGSGKMERGEGVTGLTRAVMYAGTPAVVASLWDVDDIATKELMVKFYRYMLDEGLNKEEALRRAKLDLIKSKKYASPVYWSAFVMYGE